MDFVSIKVFLFDEHEKNEKAVFITPNDTKIPCSANT